ncbi:putative transcriptional regulator [Pseudomonas sp. PvR086]|uniref:hypothetical protein n=1 Tax=Pseudomonas TaxID=286 RepID=UPI0017876F5F|nr:MULTISPECIES: hypothetical protein [Pseudomonas]MBD9617431.1 hypothetical protein [Pseudomonas sp. PDM07]MDR7108124.1 putative transcriptional regulator [Pseudomonas frederiksbergensis]
MTAKKTTMVLSMHRSGNIALARALSTMGVELGAPLHPMDMDHTASFWKDRDVTAVNNKLLSRLDSASALDLPAPTEDEISKYINEYPDPGSRHAQHLESVRLNSQTEPKILANANLESISLKTQIKALNTENVVAHGATTSTATYRRRRP